MSPRPGAGRRWAGFAMVGAAACLAAFILVSPRFGAAPPAAARAGPAPCYTTRQLDLSGALGDCAAVRSGRLDCAPLSSPENYAFATRLHGSRHDYLFYVEVPGTYSGPGSYPLRPWPDDNLGASDGIPKVAVREFISGDLWESVEGTVIVARDGESGSVSATLSPVGGAQSGRPDVRVDGHWQCG